MTKKTEKVKIHREDGMTIGYVLGDTFHKNINSKAHIVHIPPEIANDICALHEAEAAGAKWCHVHTKDTDKNYYASFKTIWEKGAPLDRSYGKQWALLLKYWKEEPSTQESLF